MNRPNLALPAPHPRMSVFHIFLVIVTRDPIVPLEAVRQQLLSLDRNIWNLAYYRFHRLGMFRG